MKINYIEENKSITIKDKLKLRHLMTYTTLILTLINSILYPLGYFSANQTITWIWFIIGILSLGTLTYTFLKRTAVEKIRVQNIISLEKRKRLLGQSYYSLKLSNGKHRDLLELKTQVEKQELLTLLNQIGVKAIL